MILYYTQNQDKIKIYNLFDQNTEHLLPKGLKTINFRCFYVIFNQDYLVLHVHTYKSVTPTICAPKASERNHEYRSLDFLINTSTQCCCFFAMSDGQIFLFIYQHNCMWSVSYFKVQKIDESRKCESRARTIVKLSFPPSLASTNCLDVPQPTFPPFSDRMRSAIHVMHFRFIFIIDSLK